ncbi:MAG: hypothetical protein CMJ24_04770 [Phycisphaerae bacterium]|nr:hypothetical protein [Phycisphaerae bacterium]|tara:strand:+ start:290 stop:1543 length:1254 start_codon:yes stop_codon:yes gene_type:complete
MITRRSSWLVTGIIAVLLGVVIGVLAIPTWRAGSRIDRVASDDVSSRTTAWKWWMAPDETGAPRAIEALDSLNASLVEGSDDALLQGADQLHRLGLWGWTTQPHALMTRHLQLLAWRSHVLDVEDAIELVETAPLDASTETVATPVLGLLAHGDPAVARRTLRTLAAWAGISPRLDVILRRLPEDRSHWGDPYRKWLGCGRRPLRIDEAATPTFTTIDPLDAADTTPDMMVVTTLGIADSASRTDEEHEIGLDDPEAVRRQMAALLTALEQGDDEALAQAMLVERDSRTRLTMRLALDALGRPTSDDHPGEFARRAMRQEDERIWHPAVLTRLIAGDPDLLEPLFEAAVDPNDADRAAAWSLTIRFLPDWIDVEPAGDPGCDFMDAESLFAGLLARWHLERRRLVRDDMGRFHSSGL